MGLFDFMKKKQSEQQQSSRDFDLSELSTDLPPVVGSELSQTQQSIPHYSQQLPQLEQNLPELDIPQSISQSISQNTPNIVAPQDAPQETPNLLELKSTSKSSMTVNVAPLDFSMPASDDHESISDELNKLFLTDKGWKEPDWNSFDPYSEPEIEHPTSKDFGVATQNTDLPKFDDLNTEDTLRKRTVIPVDVYVKGSDYTKVFSELIRVTDILKFIDPKIDQANNIFSKEELLMKDAKEDMEYAYKKLIYIEKRIFNDT